MTFLVLAYGFALITLAAVLLIAAVVVRVLDHRADRPQGDTAGPGIELIDGSLEVQ